MNPLVHIIGQYYGYPQCCIDAFDEFFDDLSKKQEIQKDETIHHCNGFIPCVYHCQQIQKGKTKLEKLIINRICPQPFPYEGSEAQLNKHIKLKIKQYNERNNPPPVVGRNDAPIDMGVNNIKKRTRKIKQ